MLARILSGTIAPGVVIGCLPCLSGGVSDGCCGCVVAVVGLATCRSGAEESAISPRQPTYDLRRISLDIGIRRNISKNHGAGGDDRAAPDGHPWRDHRTDADPCPVLDGHGLGDRLADALGAGTDPVTPGVDEDVRRNGRSLPDRD